MIELIWSVLYGCWNKLVHRIKFPWVDENMRVDASSLEKNPPIYYPISPHEIHRVPNGGMYICPLSGGVHYKDWKGNITALGGGGGSMAPSTLSEYERDVMSGFSGTESEWYGEQMGFGRSSPYWGNPSPTHGTIYKEDVIPLKPMDFKKKLRFNVE